VTAPMPVELLPFTWLYAQSRLQLREIVPPAPRADGGVPGFRAVHPIELSDPSEFLVPDAVVLTVGIPLHDHDPGDPEAFAAAVDSYVARIAATGAVGIGFGTALFFDELPEALVTACRAHRLALFEIPRPVPFMSILGAVQDERTRRARLVQEHLLDIQQRLTAAAVGGGMEALLSTLATELDAAVAAAREQRTSSAAEDPATGTWRVTQLMEKQGERRHLLTVLARHPFTPHDRSVLRHCSGLADLILQRPSYLRSAERRLNSLAMSLLLGIGDGPGADGAVPQAFATAVDADGRIRPVVLQADRAGDLTAALNRTDRRAADRGRQLFALTIGPDTALLFVRGSRTVDQVVADVGAARRSLRIAVGEPVGWQEITLERVRRLETSARALPQGEAAGPFEAGADWLSDAAVQTALDRRAAETVDRLAEADAAGAALTETLVSWLRSGSKAATAEELGVHRHTVHDRLRRIARLCEVDLGDPVARAELLLVAVTRTRAGSGSHTGSSTGSGTARHPQ
jgi:purine catabolism regulator